MSCCLLVYESRVLGMPPPLDPKLERPSAFCSIFLPSIFWIEMYFATQRSMHTISPLLRSGSWYFRGIHLFRQFARMLWTKRRVSMIMTGSFHSNGERVFCVPIVQIHEHFYFLFSGFQILWIHVLLCVATTPHFFLFQWDASWTPFFFICGRVFLFQDASWNVAYLPKKLSFRKFLDAA
jgi:hypothetical protein